MTQIRYLKSAKYTDLDAVHAQCSGPGGLRLSDFMAQKMGLVRKARLRPPSLVASSGAVERGAAEHVSARRGSPALWRSIKSSTFSAHGDVVFSSGFEGLDHGEPLL